MNTNAFIALINPGMALIFASTFFLLWRNRPQARYIAVMGTGYLLMAFAFMLQYFVPFGMAASKFAANLFFLSGGICLAQATLGRLNRPLPTVGLAVAAACGMAAFSWFLFVQPDLNWRIYSVNFAFGTIALLLAAELRAVPRRRMIDNLLLGVVLVWGVSFFPRPIFILWFDGPYGSDVEFHESLYWITLVFSASLFMLLFALTMISAIALDVMEELRHESQTDALSGLLNRRGFEDRMAEAMRQARRRGLPVTLVVCDLDHFKSINDSHGHAGGDRVIATFAKCLRSTAGDETIVGRIGGEEFAVLLLGTNLGTGRLFSEGARAAFATLVIPGLGEELRCTASFGVAQWRHGETVAALFARADEALYRAKRDGRDRVRVARNGDRVASNGDATELPGVAAGT